MSIDLYGNQTWEEYQISKLLYESAKKNKNVSRKRRKSLKI